MPSTSALSESFAIWHYDGASALRHARRLVVEGGTHFRLIDEAGASSDAVALTDLVPVETAGSDAVFGHRTRPGWRIGFFGGAPDELAHALPGARRYGGLIDRFGLWRSVGLFAVVALVALYFAAQTPALVAHLVPRALERRMGDLMLGDFGGRACARPEGVKMLRSLTQRLGVSDEVATVDVVNIPIVNAVTLPGGHILIFDGLLQQAGSPDELAGVIGHELGHVEHRDVIESLLRQLGLSVLLGGLDGNIGGYTNALVSSAYSRDAESRADQYAIRALNSAGISPAPTAEFFKRLEGKAGKPGGATVVLNYLASHPPSARRAERFRSAARRGEAYTPTLQESEWQALRGICRGAKADPVTSLDF